MVAWVGLWRLRHNTADIGFPPAIRANRLAADVNQGIAELAALMQPSDARTGLFAALRSRRCNGATVTARAPWSPIRYIIKSRGLYRVASIACDTSAAEVSHESEGRDAQGRRLGQPRHACH